MRRTGVISQDDQRKIIDKIVDGIANDVSGRSGLGNQWEEIDKDTKAGIYNEWRGIVISALGAASADRDADGDLLVNFGDMRGFTLDSLKEIMGGKVDDNHEGMVEEHLLAFNYAVSQGIHPGQALFACVQAIGLLLGYAIRSGMHPSVGAAMTAVMIKATQEGAKNVQIITTN